MLSGGANRWTNWVKEFALMNNLSYGCALSTPECRNEYREKYGTRKKLTKKQEKEQMGAEEPTGAINKQLQKKAETKKKEHKGRVTEMKAKLNKNLAKKEIIEKGKELQERNQMGAEDINQAKNKKIKKVKKPKQNIQLIIEEQEEEPLEPLEPVKRKRGRPKKYETAEEARQMKIKNTIEAQKKRNSKLRDEKKLMKAEDKGTKKGRGFDPLPDFKEQVESAESNNPVLLGSHWDSSMMPHLQNELANYQNITHHLGQHLNEAGAKDIKDLTGYRHFSNEADKIKKLLKSLSK